MLDPKLLRDKPGDIKDNLTKRKKPEFIKMVDEYVDVDIKWREADKQVNQLRKTRNTNAKKIGKAKGDEKTKLIEDMKQVNKELSMTEEALTQYAERRQWLLDRIPNLLHESVPFGESDEDNVEIRSWGNIPEHSFEVKDHHDLMDMLDLVELDRARKTSGARFYFLKNEAVILEMALLRFALDKVKEAGRQIISTPSMVRKNMLYGTGFLPTGEEDIYRIDGEDLNLIGTSEVTLGGMHAEETFVESELPIRYAGLSSCYRTEASASTKDDKGIFRVHEFKKVEMFSFVHPDKSWEEQEKMISLAESIFQELELPYRVVNICTGDIGAVASRKYDIEVWMPGQKRFREVVSCSNCTDYQARRLQIKYREKVGSPPVGFVHTLNSTAITTTRPIIAILENFQQQDGSILIPKVLQKYTGFDTISQRVAKI